MLDHLDSEADLSASLMLLAPGTLASLLAMSIAAKLVGMAAYPLVAAVHKQANAALGIFGFLISLFSGLLVFFAFSSALRVESGLLARNRQLLVVARLVTAILILELTFSFIAREARTFLIVHVGNATQIDFMTLTWSLLLGIAIPAALLTALFVLAPRWHSAQTPD